MEEGDELHRKLGGLIRGFRVRKGFSQQRFARYAGIDRSYYAKIERGEAEVSLTILRSITKGLGLKLSELFLVLEKHLE